MQTDVDDAKSHALTTFDQQAKSVTNCSVGSRSMTIYDFGTSARQAGLKRIFRLSSDISSAKSAAADIDLMSVPYQNYADDTDTDFDTALDEINSEISTPGDGTSSSSP
ncbi:MAG: hypothetical protein P8Z80_08335 [Pseudolabrys sp.]|jgi:hypothetical protein